MKFSLIAAVDSEYGIGKDGKLPWHLPNELEYFSHITIGEGNNAVIMGRTTWESLPKKFRPLKNRLNIVLTRQEDYELPDGVVRASSLDEALQLAKKKDTAECFVIGGTKVFSEAITHPDCAQIYLTEINKKFDCDTSFPLFDKQKFEQKSRSEVQSEKDIEYEFSIYKRV
ncbi:diacylglycerol kinase [Candidatus Peregrinibacteria bacterium CG11_big_fil_rev_8_21_14_0_20_46_8]|nr:MAG: diacylglycerol kinase [Candidatus Peregrinibacteria bacterium CG11_big_fil_rev_8_21_14_0_20_46_8]